MKLDYRELAFAAGVLLLSGTLVTCTRQANTLDTELFPLAAMIQSDAAGNQSTAIERTPVDPLLLTPVPQPDEHCLNCHTDAEDLKALAKEEAPAEVLSSGEG